MQRWCAKLRAFSLLPTSTTTRPTLSPPSLNRFYHFASIQNPSPFSAISSHFKPNFNGSISSQAFPRNGVSLYFFPNSHVQVRNFSAISKEKKWKKLTPATSKVKKIKMKTYSSFKGRFKTLKDGTIRRWREGKRHNAHLKSKKAKRRLRKPALVHAAYATTMKKLNFCG